MCEGVHGRIPNERQGPGPLDSQCLARTCNQQGCTSPCEPSTSPDEPRSSFRRPAAHLAVRAAPASRAPQCAQSRARMLDWDLVPPPWPPTGHKASSRAPSALLCYGGTNARTGSCSTTHRAIARETERTQRAFSDGGHTHAVCEASSHTCECARKPQTLSLSAWSFPPPARLQMAGHMCLLARKC